MWLKRAEALCSSRVWRHWGGPSIWIDQSLRVLQVALPTTRIALSPREGFEPREGMKSIEEAGSMVSKALNLTSGSEGRARGARDLSEIESSSRIHTWTDPSLSEAARRAPRSWNAIEVTKAIEPGGKRGEEGEGGGQTREIRPLPLKEGR